MKKSEEEQIKKIMKNLELTYEEALEVFENDRAIDKGQKLFELSEEQKKIAKEMTITTGKTKVDAYGKKSVKQKKVNNDKMEIIEILQKALAENGAIDLQTANAEREFFFVFKDTKYKIVMSVPRK